VHTAFIGDIILVTPLLQAIRDQWHAAQIIVVAIPVAAGVLSNHPAVDEIVTYDKKQSEQGIGSLLNLARRLQEKRCDLALVPHRSLRSAVLARLAQIPCRIGFTRSAGRFLFTDLVRYDKLSHEIDRNLSLLSPLGIPMPNHALPSLHPDAIDRRIVEAELSQKFGTGANEPLIGVAPGSVWNTKRWPLAKFLKLSRMVYMEGARVALIGGMEDRALCEIIEVMLPPDKVLNVAGRLSLLQSAELIRRCVALVSNDSAPLHMAVAMRTPVVALFGATVPRFGFAPRGEHDVVVETFGLPCRPCSRHGGERCPIGTFECMENIEPERIVDALKTFASRTESKVFS
jgi:heptosyltransferase-2